MGLFSVAFELFGDAVEVRVTRDVRLNFDPAKFIRRITLCF